MKLLPTTTITTAVTGTTTTPIELSPDTNGLVVTAFFDYGSGGTTAKFWIQTSVDGVHWHDVINFAFTTADLHKIAAVTLPALYTVVN